MVLHRVARTFVVLVVLPLLILGCVNPSAGDPSSSQHGPNLGPALQPLRDATGFYVDPTYYDEPGSAYATALLLDGLQTGLAKIEKAEAERLCRSAERESIGEPWFSWSMSVLLGSDAPCQSAEPPEVTGRSNHDVPMYFAWVDSRLRIGARPDQLREPVRAVLSQVDGDVGAYVMWRRDQLEDLLLLPSTAGDRPASAPTTLAEPQDLADLWGYEMRCRPRPELCGPEGRSVTAEEAAWAALAFSDDVSLAAALAVAQQRGDQATLNALRRDVSSRRIDGNGLVRHQWFFGTIDASFQVLRLAPELFPGPEPHLTSRDLQGRLELLPESSRVQRLRALALLKAVDSRSWEARRVEVDRAHEYYQGIEVTQKNLHSYLDASAAFSAMNLDIPTATLALFPVVDDSSKYDALVAVGSSYAFSNDAQIQAAYEGLRREALDSVKEPREPVMSYVASLQALNGTDIGMQQQDMIEIRRSLDDSLRGCWVNGRRVEKLYRFKLDPNSTCSLSVTVGVVNSGFGGIG